MKETIFAIQWEYTGSWFIQNINLSERICWGNFQLKILLVKKKTLCPPLKQLLTKYQIFMKLFQFHIHKNRKFISIMLGVPFHFCQLWAVTFSLPREWSSLALFICLSTICVHDYLQISLKYLIMFECICVDEYTVCPRMKISFFTPYCSKSKKNLTISVCRTKCSSLLNSCTKYQQNSVIIT